MPNWCFSWIEIKGNKKSLKLIYDEMEKALSSNPLDSDFGNNWLGNLLYHIGVDKDDIIDSNKSRCRGSVTELELNEDFIALQTESAWGPHISCIEKFCKHYANDVTVLYTAEEPGNGLYWTNNPNDEDTYLIDRTPGDSKSELNDFIEGLDICGWTKDQITDTLSEYLKHSGTFEELTDEITELVEEDDGHISFNQYEFVPIGADT